MARDMTYALAYSCLFLVIFANSALSEMDSLIFEGFKQTAGLNLDGYAQNKSNGLLQLTNDTMRVIGHAFYPTPFRVLDSSSAVPTTRSFSTEFVFDIVTDGNGGGNGFAFAMAPGKTLPYATSAQYIGLFGMQNLGNSSNHVLAIEFDTVQAIEFFDIDDNHVGIDINSVISNVSETAGYYRNDSKKEVINLQDGQPIQAWIDYDGVGKILNVTISPFNVPKPRRPLISCAIDLSLILKEYMYVGFSSSTGKLTSSQYILGWSFRVNGAAQALDISKLPVPPQAPSGASPKSKFSGLNIRIVTSISVLLFVALVVFVILYLRQRAKLTETLEDWELDYPRRFPFKDLYKATKGFKESEILGFGGFGQVYKGVLHKTGEEIAIKRNSNSSKQGAKEFVAEIVSLGNLSHRNLVHLQGWCKRNNDLILVYEFMQNGGLDTFLFDRKKNRWLSWERQFKILKDIALGLLYLHEEWEHVIVHRDVKASNVLLDMEMNGRLGDFGLARLHEHGENPQTTHVVGTIGYIAPELSRTGKATTSTDVFAYGMLVLEVVCGRRPVELSASPRRMLLLDWVRECHVKVQILEVVDPRLGNSYIRDEAELVLRLGLICTHPLPGARATMRQVVQYLNGQEHLNEDIGLVFSEADTWDLACRSFPTSFDGLSTNSVHGSK